MQVGNEELPGINQNHMSIVAVGEGVVVLLCQPRRQATKPAKAQQIVHSI